MRRLAFFKCEGPLALPYCLIVPFCVTHPQGEEDGIDDGLRGSGFEGGVFDEGEEEEPEYQSNWKM